MTDLSPQKFLTLLCLLCLTYLGFELWFNQYAMLSVDEFWFAHRIHEYKNGLPYRDFSPYKTVLGYYMLLLPMTFSHGIMHTLILTKNVIALGNALILLAASVWLSRFFSRSGVLCSLALLLSMEITLSYSTHIRVDLLAYWFCLFSLLLLLDKRFIMAGILLGLGFATSQKAIWYLFASNIACGVQWLTSARKREIFLSTLQMNLATAAVIISYLFFWSLTSDWHTVINSVFVEASAMYHLDWYDASRELYWFIILAFNPLPFLLWPLTLLSLMMTFPDDHHYAERRFVIVYACTILLCLIPYKQVFPYYMQVTIPVFLVLNAAFFSWLIAAIHQRHQLQYLIDKKFVYGFVGVYLLAVITTVWIMQLPYAYLLLLAIPLSLMSAMPASTCRQLITITASFIGLIYPFALYTTKLIGLNGGYQQANIAAIHTLLEDGTDYTAGIELIYNKTQPIAGLRHLMGPAIDYLYQPSAKIRPVMTAALYEDPTVTSASVIQALQQSQVKFYVNNYRMHALPPTIKQALENTYQHWWGSIYLYAPRIATGKHNVEIKFAGDYILQTPPGSVTVIDGKSYAPGAHLTLAAKTMTVRSSAPFRLQLVPHEKQLQPNPAFQHDEWEKMIF